ncbi:MAG: hypothetical protein JRI22_22755 [Deltaproteobacteria bacterium]|nr:hypothetical protein [Deltaproteobacteria bacterium]
MIWRSLQAYLAVEAEKNGGGNKSLLDHEEAISECLSFTMPFAALGESMAETAIKGAHFHAKAALNGGKPRTVAVMPGDPMKAADAFTARAKHMLPEERKSALTRFISRAKSQQDPEQKAPALLAVIELATAVCDGRLNLEPDDQYRLMSFFADSTMIDAESSYDEVEEVFNTLSGVMDLDLEHDLFHPAAFLGFRLGCQLQKDGGRRPGRRRRDENEIVRLSEEVYRLAKSGGACS